MAMNITPQAFDPGHPDGYAPIPPPVFGDSAPRA
jgi:hypothetical protein